MLKQLKKLWNQQETIARRAVAGYATAVARLRSIPVEQEGSNLMEYALLAAIIGLIIVVAGPPVAQAVQAVFTKIARELSQAAA